MTEIRDPFYYQINLLVAANETEKLLVYIHYRDPDILEKICEMAIIHEKWEILNDYYNLLSSSYHYEFVNITGHLCLICIDMVVRKYSFLKDFSHCGHLQVFEKWYHRDHRWLSDFTIVQILHLLIRSKNIALFQWLDRLLGTMVIDGKIERSPCRLTFNAVESNNVHILKWILDKGFLANDFVLSMAIGKRNYYMINLLMSHHCQWDHLSTECTIMIGDLSLLQWTHRTYQYKLNTSHLSIAAKKGHLHIMQWLYDQKIHINDDVFKQAITGGHVHVLEWLKKHHPICRVWPSYSANRSYLYLKWIQKNDVFILSHDQQKYLRTVDQRLEILKPFVCEDILKTIQKFI